MGAEPQETRGIPRNRKCGNCRFYEPAPLWRKGWCRNTKLYPPHANHLVDANTIDCEGGFRSRIYWEALASGQVTPTIASDERPITNSNVTPIKPITGPVSPVAPASYTDNDPFLSRASEPSAETYQTPLAASDRPSLSVYKHPLADRSFAIKASDDAVRSVNTNPSPIISRAALNPDSKPPTSPRQPLVTPASNGNGNGNGNGNSSGYADAPESAYPSYNPRGGRSFNSQNYSSQNYGSQNFGSQNQAPAARNFNTPEPSPRIYPNQPQDFSPRNYSNQDQGQDQETQNNLGSQETAPAPTPRRYTPQEAVRPFITQPAPTPPPASGYGQVYGDNSADFEEPGNFNEAAPTYEDQAPTRPYRAQPQQYAPPKSKQPQAWTEQDMPEGNQFDEMDDYPPGQGPGNNYSPPSGREPSGREYPTQPGNYGSQYGAEKEPIRIQEALPVNNRPRPYEPRKQSQPAPARFRPVKEDQPAANMPVTRDWRAILREKAPFTRNWNLEGIAMNRQILPWAIGVVLVLILAVVLVANIGKKSDPNNPTVPAGTVAAGVTVAATPGAGSTATSGSGATTGASKTTAAGAGGTTVAGTTAAATTAAASKTALVKGTGGDGLNMRETPSKSGAKVTSIKDGEKVNIKDGPKDADGLTWYQIEYQGKTGWASSAYLEIQS